MAQFTGAIVWKFLNICQGFLAVFPLQELQVALAFVLIEGTTQEGTKNFDQVNIGVIFSVQKTFSFNSYYKGILWCFMLIT